MSKTVKKRQAETSITFEEAQDLVRRFRDATYEIGRLYQEIPLNLLSNKLPEDVEIIAVTPYSATVEPCYVRSCHIRCGPVKISMIVHSFDLSEIDPYIMSYFMSRIQWNIARRPEEDRDVTRLLNLHTLLDLAGKLGEMQRLARELRQIYEYFWNREKLVDEQSTSDSLESLSWSSNARYIRIEFPRARDWEMLKRLVSILEGARNLYRKAFNVLTTIL